MENPAVDEPAALMRFLTGTSTVGFKPLGNQMACEMPFHAVICHSVKFDRGDVALLNPLNSMAPT